MYSFTPPPFLIAIVALSILAERAACASKTDTDYEYYEMECDAKYEEKMDGNCDFMINSLYDINIPNGRPKDYKGASYSPLEFAKLVEDKKITEKDLDVFYPFWNIKRNELQGTVNEVCQGLIGMAGVREACCSVLKVLCGFYDYEDAAPDKPVESGSGGKFGKKKKPRAVVVPATTTVKATASAEKPAKGRPLTQFLQTIFGKIFT